MRRVNEVTTAKGYDSAARRRATGITDRQRVWFFDALHVLNARKAHEIIVALPVAPPQTLERFRPQCGHVECLLTPGDFQAISQFYEDFQQVEDEEVSRLLRESRAPLRAWQPGAHV